MKFSQLRFIAGLAVAQIGTASNIAGAQSTLEVRPTFRISEIYESNLFSAPAGGGDTPGTAPRHDDAITRLSPGVESNYRAPRWTASARYSLDVERFAKRTNLTSAAARQHAGATLTYQATARVRVNGGAEFVTTRTPQELNTVSGLAFARTRGSRLSAHSSVSRDLSPVTVGTIEYTFSQDRLGRGFQAFTHLASFGAARRMSPRTQLRARYRREQHAFTTTSIEQSTLASHAVSLEAVHDLSPRLTASIEAGPRVTGDAVRPELSASITWNNPRGDLSFGYRRTQTTVFGVIGAADVQSLRVSWARLSRHVDVRVAPAVIATTLAGQRAHVYALAASLGRRMSTHLALELSIDSAVQYGNLYRVAAGEIIPRHVAVIRFVAAPATQR